MARITELQPAQFEAESWNWNKVPADVGSPWVMWRRELVEETKVRYTKTRVARR